MKKIDAEGAEIDVIEGMAAPLRTYRPVIVCEMHGRNKEFGALMRSFDYDLTTLEMPTPVEDAPWWVHVLAAHSSDADACSGPLPRL